MANKCSKCQSDNPDTQQYCGECGITTGSTFAGRYQIIEELDKGGMGKVYRVLDKELKEEVALKLIKPEMPSSVRISLKRHKSFLPVILY